MSSKSLLELVSQPEADRLKAVAVELGAKESPVESKPEDLSQRFKKRSIRAKTMEVAFPFSSFQTLVLFDLILSPNSELQSILFLDYPLILSLLLGRNFVC